MSFAALLSSASEVFRPTQSGFTSSFPGILEVSADGPHASMQHLKPLLVCVNECVL